MEESGRFFQLAGMSGLSEVYFADVADAPVTFVFDERTGDPLSYSLDLTAALEAVTNRVLAELNGGEADETITVEAYTISSSLTQLGGVKAEPLPEQAKHNAINYEKEISLLAEGETNENGAGS